MHEELSAGEGREGALVAEGREALEGGEKGREEGNKERVIGPVRGGGEGREGGAEGSELGVEDLPSASEGAGGEGGEEKDGKEVVDEVEEGLW